MATTLAYSPRCVPFAFRRARRLPAPAQGSHGPAAPRCGRRLCRAAEVVGGGIRGAFFASLDRCSCVELRTKHDESFRTADAAAPLMRVDGSSSYGAASSGDDGGAAAASGRRASGGKGNKQRHGLGCCAANSTSIN